MAAASLHPASTAAADCGRGPQIHADCTHRDLLGFSRPSIQESRWSSSADQAFSHGARRGTTSPASPPSSRPSPHRRLTQCRTSGAALPPRRRVTGACAPMRVPPSTSPGRSPSAIATTTAAWWCGWAFAPREYNGLLRRPPLLFWLLPQLDSALTSTPARPQPAAGRETASRQRPAPNQRRLIRRGLFARGALAAVLRQPPFTP